MSACDATPAGGTMGWARAVGLRSTTLRSWPPPPSEVLADPVEEDPGLLGEDQEEPARYVLREPIGRGGLGVVYLAEDRGLDREVAVKLLARPDSCRLATRSQFLREARAAASLRHPHIVMVHDIGELHGQPFICMELLRGLTLEDVLERTHRLGCLHALEVTAHILSALRFAHGHGVIHRDVKPGNIMVTRAGEAKLMDFGIAQCGAQDEDEVIAGTPGYMSPEQIEGGPVDPRSDVFSLGVCLYRMLTGEMPFDGLDRSRPAPRIEDPEVPRAIEAVAQVAVRIEPGARFPTAGAMLATVQRLLGAAAEYERRHQVLRPSLGALVRRLELGPPETLI